MNFADNFKFKSINRINAFLRVLFKGNIQVNNVYQTEELEKILHKNFRNELKSSFNILKRIGVFNKSHSFFRSLPLRSKGTSERYSIITIANLFKNES